MQIHLDDGKISPERLKRITEMAKQTRGATVTDIWHLSAGHCVSNCFGGKTHGWV